MPTIQWNAETIGIAAVVALLLAGAIWWFWWWLPKRQVRKLNITDPKDRVDIENDFRRTIGQVLGGAAVLVGAGFAYLQFIDQRQATSAQLISNQVSKGFEQLASDNPTMRLGGIYALEGVMNTSSEYHRPVLEALCAFVRNSTTGKVDEEPTIDVQAALTVIGRREQGPKDVVDLVGANIPGANLARANLAGAVLHDANLAGADLSGADMLDADLSRANLSHADLKIASLTVAHLNQADLSDADLTGTTVTQHQLDNACGTDTKLPPGLTLKPCPDQ